MERLIRLFTYTAGGVLLAMALVNLMGTVGSAQVLRLPDPLLIIPLWIAMLITGGMEFAVALVCLFGQRPGLQTSLIAWLATTFAVYRIALIWQRGHWQWGCLGNLSATLHIPSGVAGFVMISMLVYLLLGGYVLLLWPWLGKAVSLVPLRNRRQAVESLKMSCPECGGHIKFAHQNFGQRIACPHCQTSITLRKPDFLKIACFFCKEHIEFPAHAVGEKISCPHCKMDITLK